MINNTLIGCELCFTNLRFHRVKAENKQGLGEAAQTETCTAKNPFGLPGAPSKPEAINVQKRELVLIWNKPTEDGGSTISNYVVERRSKSSGKWVQMADVKDCRARIANLIEGKEYEFQVCVSIFNL